MDVKGRAIVNAFGLVVLVGLSACSDPVGSKGWCEVLDEKSKSDWSGEEATQYLRYCVFESTTLGSEDWCDDQAEKDKADWTLEESTVYARYCVIP